MGTHSSLLGLGGKGRGKASAPNAQTHLATPSDPKPILHVRLGNRRAVFLCPAEMQPKLKEHFRYHPPNYQFYPAYREGAWEGWNNLMLRGAVPTGLFLEKQKELGWRYDLRIEDLRTTLEFPGRTPAGLRPYQLIGLDAMIAASTTGGLILSATGSGKTRLAGAYFARLRGTGCFIVDELALLEQTRRELEAALNEKVGVVGKSAFVPERITVATIQTLHRHRSKSPFQKWFKTLDVLIIDEIHIALNRRNFDIVTQIKPSAVFGLTATLELEKPHIFFPAVALAGPVIFEYPIQQGVEEKYLSSGVIVRLFFDDPLKGQAPGYWTTRVEHQKEVRHFVPNESIPAQYRYHVILNRARNDCIEALARESVRRGHRMIVLVERRAHLAVLDHRLKDINHRTLSGLDAPELRLAAMRAMDAGTLPLILASRVFSRGVDVKSVDVIVDGAALPGRNSAIQRYGRGARKAEGKERILYINIADRGNPYESAARLRLKALRETGSPVVDVTWKPGMAGKVFE